MRDIATDTAAPRAATRPRRATAAADKTPAPSAKAPDAVIAKPAKPVKPPKVEKAEKNAEKAKKPKLVRDSFTIPKGEYTAIDDLKKRTAILGLPAKKSELLRAGLKALTAMDDEALRSALAAVPAIKTGRPAKV